MNKFNLPILALAVRVAPLALADDEHPANPATSGGATESTDGMMVADDAMHEDMQERMQAMRQTMQKIHDARDPAEGRQLMQEHMQLMHETMDEMGRMGRHGVRGRRSDQIASHTFVRRSRTSPATS